MKRYAKFIHELASSNSLTSMIINNSCNFTRTTILAIPGYFIDFYRHKRLAMTN